MNRLKEILRTVALHQYAILFTLILILSFGLRLYDLSDESLWLDEVATVDIASKPIHAIVLYSLSSDTHPPLYYILLHYWMFAFGESEFSLRFLSLLFGMGAVILMYQYCKLHYSQKTGIVASFLLGISLIHIEYSQEARMYTLATFLTLLSFLSYMNVLKHATGRAILGYLLSTILMIYAHLFGIFMLIAQSLHYLYLYISRKQGDLPLRQWIIINCVIVIVVSLWLYPASGFLFDFAHHFWISRPAPSILASTIVSYTRSMITSIVLIFFAAFSFARVKPKTPPIDKSPGLRFPNGADMAVLDKNFVALLWFALPFLLPFFLSFFFSPLFFRRYTIMASVGLYLLAAVGLGSLKKNLFRLAMLGVILLTSSYALVDYYTTYQKEPWREAAHLIDSKALTGDLVLYHLGYTRQAYAYYGERVDIAHESFPNTTLDMTKDKLGDLDKIIDDNAGVWLVLSHARDPDNLIEAFLASRYEYREEKEFRGIRVFLFRNNSSAQ